MAILDYSRTLNAAGQQTPLQGMIETRKGLQGLQANDMAMKQQQQQQEAQQAEIQRMQEARVQGAELLKNGTPEQIAEFGIMNPKVMKDLIAASGFVDDRAVNSRLNYAKNVLSGSVSPRDAINARIQEIESRGGNADQLRMTAQGTDEQIIEAARKDFSVIDPQGFKSYMSATGQQGISGQPSAVKETEWFNKQTPEVQETHLKIKRGEKPTLDNKLEYEQAKSNLAVEEEGRKTASKGIAKRQQGFIDSGIEAADSLANLKRSKQLLDSVKTGGFDKAALAAKRFFGIESANEAELSAGMGKAILAQLKPIFGAAFTAAEGERLEKIEANFGKSTEGNKRLLSQIMKIVDRSARRGLKAAEKAGDDFTAEEIKNAMEFKLDVAEADNANESAALTDDQLLQKYGG